MAQNLTDTQSHARTVFTRTGLRRTGAIAGLAPAAAVVALFIVFGEARSREAILWLGAISILAVVAGSLVGPLAGGSLRSDLRAFLAYALVGSVAYLVVGTLASAWPSQAAGAAPDLGALATRMAGQLLYGLLYLPFWAGWVAPFALLWIIALRVLRGRAGLAPASASGEVAGDGASSVQRISPRRMGLFAAALIAAYALFVAVLPLLLDNDPRPPWWMYRPIALFVLFSMPATIAAVGAIWSRRSLLVAAGAICLIQSYVAFSGVTIGFIIPAVLLIVLGSGERWPRKTHETRTALVAPIVVIALAIAAWVATLGLTEEVCWSATRAADGSLTYERLPVTDVMAIPPGQVASGCDGGTLTVEGLGMGAIMAVGAIAVAAAAVWASRDGVAPG